MRLLSHFSRLLVVAGLLCAIRAGAQTNYAFTTIDHPLAVNGTYSVALNNSGSAVGFYYDSDYVYHGFAWRKGLFTAIEAPGAGQFSFGGTVPSGINAAGAIVGYYYDASGEPHGFLLSGGSLFEL